MPRPTEEAEIHHLGLSGDWVVPGTLLDLHMPLTELNQPWHPSVLAYRCSLMFVWTWVNKVLNTDIWLQSISIASSEERSDVCLCLRMCVCVRWVC